METKRTTKITALILVLLLLASLMVGCRASTPEPAPASEAQQSSTVPQDKYVMKFAHDYTTNSPYHEAAVKFKELVEAKSEGRMEVQIYPAQQLGSAREMIEGMQMGTIEMVWTPTAKFAGFDQRLTLIDLPYLFKDEDTMWKALEGELGQKLMGYLEPIGIKGISFCAEGYKIFTANKPIKSPEDFAGMKIRTMEAPVIMAQFKAWGANPVPIDFAEVYNALQQKVVDGQENPIITIHDMKFYEVQDYLSVADHAYLTYFLSASKKWYDGLPEDLQKIVMDSGLEMTEYHKGLIKDANDRYLQNVQDYGTQIYVLNDEERQALKDSAIGIYAEFEEVFGKELIEEALSYSN
ncbi:TRAP transporter substrate-binding protein [Acidaminobacter hydrogenoformans]|uniref:C4-dicarboxylate-binding protein DctP n=1 Tax=Acidaminobacter hydrogenoformans DSM 2784 TaxID=1120920 RepID=A0A1G5S6Y1_9FIRM|nr:TRAP transporter substrate-binding protein [Acidaminobacter hydrogenoformans]SCZ82063.1 C4-dicarboxylate-binding protein DctP [Acidaminobacter hydrogenoformans DSM 2784]